MREIQKCPYCQIELEEIRKESWEHKIDGLGFVVYSCPNCKSVLGIK